MGHVRRIRQQRALLTLALPVAVLLAGCASRQAQHAAHDLPEYLIGDRTAMWAGYLVRRP